MSMNAKDAIAYTVKSRDDRRRFMLEYSFVHLCLTFALSGAHGRPSGDASTGHGRSGHPLRRVG